MRDRSAVLLLVLTACRASPSSGEHDARPARVTADAAPSAAVVMDASPAAAGSSAPALSARGQGVLQRSLDDRTALVGRVVRGHPATRVVDGTFLLVAGERDAPLEAATKVAQDTVTALFHGALGHRSERAFVVWVFGKPATCASFLTSRVAGAEPARLAHVDSGAQEVFVCTGGPEGVAAIAPAIARVLFAADFPHAPAWLTRALVSLFDPPFFEPAGELHGKADAGLQVVRARLASPDGRATIGLGAVLKLEPEQLTGPYGDLTRAMGREALRWLDAQHHLWDFYGEWRARFRGDDPPQSALQYVLHETVEEASAEWIAWLGSLEAERP